MARRMVYLMADAAAVFPAETAMLIASNVDESYPVAKIKH